MPGTRARLQFSAVAYGARTVSSDLIDAAFSMPAGKLRGRAGIVSLAQAADGESEVTLGAAAGEAALRAAGLASSRLDWILAASETHHAFPSLAARLHLAIGAAETCGALDIGGACLGSLHALEVARAFIESGGAAAVLIVTADVHSTALVPGRVAGEFGGLFGDGAAALLVERSRAGAKPRGFLVREFFFGCASQFQPAIQVSAEPYDRLRVVFDGDALSRAATARLDACIDELERRSGIPRAEVGAFATHQPNPRLVALVAKKSGLPLEKFPLVADTKGNLGSSTCAASLHYALEAASRQAPGSRQPIFLASLGPGLLFGGGWLEPEKGEPGIP